MKHIPLKGTVSVFGTALISIGLATLISMGLATASTSTLGGPEMGENTWVQLAQGGGDPLKGLLGGTGTPCKPCDVPFGGTVSTGGGTVNTGGGTVNTGGDRCIGFNVARGKIAVSTDGGQTAGILDGSVSPGGTSVDGDDTVVEGRIIGGKGIGDGDDVTICNTPQNNNTPSPQQASGK